MENETVDFFFVNFSFLIFVSRACLIMTVINAEEKEKERVKEGDRKRERMKWKHIIIIIY